MTRGPMADALASLRARMPPVVREREILRVVATIPHPEPAAAMDRARREVLAWAQKRCGGQLPKAAWEGQGFDFLAGGRTTLGVRLLEEGTDLWALRGDDPDKTIAGRTWTTEVVIGRGADGAPRLSLRLLVSTGEDELRISPHVPGLLQQVAKHCGLRVGGYDAVPEVLQVLSADDFDQFIEMLESPERRLPVFVASGDERAADPDRPLIQADKLARATLGLAHVVVLPAAATYSLSDAVGNARSVFHGAVRVYMPGFDTAADPYQHRLILADTVRRDPEATLHGLQALAATESLRRTRLGHDVVPFAAVRSVALRAEQEARATAGASEADQLAAAKKSLEALTAERDAARAQADANFEVADQEEERAEAAEAQLRGALARIAQLKAALTSRGQDPDADITLPETWDRFADWCDEALVGRLVLAPAARSRIKKAVFADVGAAARCLLWLAGTCRDRRMNGGGSLSNISIEQGIENAPCGADAFTFDFHGYRFEADWHVKSGGNTHDPVRCLRIYYSWDETTQRIVVAEMPAHRRTGAT
jgi:hypothetical protein